jgi:hypothetical protein
MNPAQQTQGSQDMKADFKPRFGAPFRTTTDREMNSSLYRANKRTFYAPTNYIGIKSYRADNMQPSRIHTPCGVSGRYNFKGVVMTTQPVQPKYQ